MFDFFNPESPPIIIDGSPPAPSKVSSSCGSYVAHTNDDNERKNRSPEEVLSPRLPLTLDLFPTQTSTDIQESSSFSVGHNNGSNQRQEIAPATLQGSKQESAQTSTSDETRVMCVETKRSSCNAVPKKNERPVPRHKEEEKRYEGISTELVLYEDPWKIKKKLKPSDLGHLSRLLLPGTA
ncbi:hypothetical protein NL676_009172 [Syzygium grande]|nr:hypothetical protein NL676_009172 [Syzygium grande]